MEKSHTLFARRDGPRLGGEVEKKPDSLRRRKTVREREGNVITPPLSNWMKGNSLKKKKREVLKRGGL